MATLHMQLDFPVPKGPLGTSNSTTCPQTALKRPRKHQNLCTLAADSPNRKTDHILGYVAQYAISIAPNPPATTHFWWFPPPHNCPNQRLDSRILLPSGLQQAARGSPKRWVPKWVNKVHKLQREA